MISPSVVSTCVTICHSSIRRHFSNSFFQETVDFSHTLDDFFFCFSGKCFLGLGFLKIGLLSDPGVYWSQWQFFVDVFLLLKYFSELSWWRSWKTESPDHTCDWCMIDRVADRTSVSLTNAWQKFNKCCFQQHAGVELRDGLYLLNFSLQCIC